MAVVKVINGSSPGQIIPLTKAVSSIGRNKECDIVIDVNAVSRNHARFVKKGESFFLVDLNSRNRTKLNENILDADIEYALRQGDRISICDVDLVFFQTDEPISPGPEVIETEEDSTIHLVDSSRSDMMASIVKPEVKLKAILEITRNLSTNLKIDSVAPKILDSLLDLFNTAERAFLVLVKHEDASKWSFRQTFFKGRIPKRSGLRQGLGAAPSDEPRMRISRGIINQVFEQRKAVLSQDAGQDPNLPTSASIADLRIRSVMCVPLVTSDGEILGILQLDTSERKQFNPEDLDVLEAVARQATIALQNATMHESLLQQERIRRDLGLAQTIQGRFLPRSVPSVPGYEFFAHYQAAYEVGGDYYDFVDLGSGQIAVAVGDVAGKGVAAALMMARFSGDTRGCILTNHEPAAAVTQVNRLLCDADIEEKFITLCLCVLDTTRRRLRYTSAGHLPILVRRKDGRVEEYGEDIIAFPLGIEPDSTYEQGEIELAPGDVVAVYSDGLTDARNNKDERYETEKHHRLKKRLGEAGGGPTSIGKAILQDVREFSADQVQFDDITLVCFGPRSE
jgi:serine phosphatase RsbU (regulator of sigma subunit)/pSer/pThr/pTyr-binding forkhead associated (FHA) protein